MTSSTPASSPPGSPLASDDNALPSKATTTVKAKTKKTSAVTGKIKTTWSTQLKGMMNSRFDAWLNLPLLSPLGPNH
ncbi:hypothetical protein FOMPIDRAFT_1056879 [Fomitopsis schrenkii]|uniref:Uncharacterized protein n=1 Tax=Fomitopsis schrenkii TaxID=2126942 RepID=S8DM85_FOMSC|nr:hypothetical protein FOMPIDRAFT_1056879 [Fomitopsis schrenkii]